MLACSFSQTCLKDRSSSLASQGLCAPGEVLRCVGPGDGLRRTGAQHSALRRHHFTPSAVNSLLLRWIRSHLSFSLCCIYFLKMLFDFGVLIFTSLDPVFLLQVNPFRGSAVFPRRYGWRYTLFCLNQSMTPRAGHCLHCSHEGAGAQKGEATCPRLHSL